MPKRSNPFQHLVTLIETSIHAGTAKVNESVEFRDKFTNELREVDIVISLTEMAYPTIIKIECKGGNKDPRKATVEWVEQMWGKHNSLPNGKLILVSKGGFTAAAMEKAKWLDIECLNLEDAEKCNWQSKLRSMKSIDIINFVRPYVTEITLITDNTINTFSNSNYSLENSKYPELIINNTKKINIHTLVDEWINDPNIVNALFEKAYADADATTFKFKRKLIPGACFLGKNGEKYPAIAIEVKGKCHKKIDNLELKQESYGYIAVAHGTSKQFNHEFNIALTEQSGNSPNISISTKKANIA